MSYCLNSFSSLHFFKDLPTSGLSPTLRFLLIPCFFLFHPTVYCPVTQSINKVQTAFPTFFYLVFTIFVPFVTHHLHHSPQFSLVSYVSDFHLHLSALSPRPSFKHHSFLPLMLYLFTDLGALKIQDHVTVWIFLDWYISSQLYVLSFIQQVILTLFHSSCYSYSPFALQPVPFLLQVHPLQPNLLSLSSCQKTCLYFPLIISSLRPFSKLT